MKLPHFEKIKDHVKWLARQRRGKKAGFRVMLKYFEIKKAFRYYIKQIDSMLPCVWSSNRSQKTSKCGENISDTLGYASCATFLFLPHFDVTCDLLLNRRTTTWNLFVKSLVSWKCSWCSLSRLIGTYSLFPQNDEDLCFISLCQFASWQCRYVLQY